MDRRSLPASAVFAALAVTLAGAFALALWIHERFAQYEPRVVAHLPKEVTAAFWMNVEYTVGFERFEEQVLPLLEVGRQGPEPRVKLLERKTSLELEIDTREIAFARTGRAGWVFLLGGLYRRDGVVAGLRRTFEEMKVPATVEDRVVLVGSPAEPAWLGGTALTIADDGTLIWASSEDLARRSMRQEAESRAGYKALLVKPGSLIAAVAFPEFGGQEKLVPRPIERLWLSVQPGAPFPAYAEALGGGAVAPVTPFLPEVEWQAAQSPEQVWAGSAELSSEQVQLMVGRWLEWVQSSWNRTDQRI